MPAPYKPTGIPPRPKLVKRQAAAPSFGNNESQPIEAFPPTSKADPATKTTTAAPTKVTTTKATTTSVSPTSTPRSSSAKNAATSSTHLSQTSSLVSTPSSSIAPVTDSGSGGISGSAIGTIVAIIVIIIAGFVAYFLIRRRLKRTTNNRITRFSMGPGYNANTTPDSDPFHFQNNPLPAPPLAYSASTTPTAAYASTVSAGSAPVMPGPMMAAVTNTTNTTEKHQVPAVSSPPQPPPQQLQYLQQQQYMQQSQQEMQQAGGPQDLWQQQPIGTYTVVSTYTPTLNDEIEVQPGDQVQVFVEYDDGWCMGANLSRGQVRGVFPKYCVQAPSQPLSHPMAATVLGSATTGGTSLMTVDEKHLSKRVSSLYSVPH